jgi:ABC-type branched-subunit amino acid transport system ATPase component
MIGSATPEAAQLAVEELSVHFEGLAALAEVSLAVNRHEVFGLIGPNGAGKTTLVNCLTGFQRPTRGRVLLNGHDTAGWQPDYFRRAGVARTFQAGRLFKDMTVIENVEVTATGLGFSRRVAAEMAAKYSAGSNSTTRRICSPQLSPTPINDGSVSHARSSSLRPFFCSTSRLPACRTRNASI